MATSTADPRNAPLTDDLKDYALSLNPKVFPKNFFCAHCSQVGFDPFKLLCCHSAICGSCMAKLEVPITCPLCEHSPVEADACLPYAALRQTMRSFIAGRKKKKDAADAKGSQAATPTVGAAPGNEPPAADGADNPVESVEAGPKAEDAAGDEAAPPEDSYGEFGEFGEPIRLAASPPKEGSSAPQNEESQRRGSHSSQVAIPTTESTTQPGDPNSMAGMNGGGSNMAATTAMMHMNGMPGQFSSGFNGHQPSFNGMGWTGMNAMSNMVPHGNWNNMNTMDFNNMNGMSNMPNGMYNGFGGNMGMAMNDPSMMNYGGGYGNGWNSMGGASYGNFNGFNHMGGYNQSGTYPEMMNQFPKSNFPNTRFHANGGNYPQHRNHRNGSFGNLGPGTGVSHNSNSRPGSRSGPPHFRDGESPAGTANAAAENDAQGEQAKVSAEPAPEGKDDSMHAPRSATPGAQAGAASSENATKELEDVTDTAETGTNETSSGLNRIQTVDSVETDGQDYDQMMMDNGMPYPPQMMDQFRHHMNGSYDQGMGYPQNSFGNRGGFNAAYGAATVLTGEPRGVGVEGAPTGPRAMREGRPNTGFSSRANNARYSARLPSTTPTQEAAPGSPPRRLRSRSPDRDDSLRTKERSPSRSRSRDRDEDRDDYREGSVGHEDRRDDRGRSQSPQAEDDYERRKERRHHRSSRYDDRDDRYERDDYDDRHREDRDDRGDRTRSASADSKYRSRRDKEKRRASRSHRDRSREHRRRHRSRSRSPAEEKHEEEDSYANGTDESGSRRKKEKYRKRDRSKVRDRDRDRRDRKERDYDRDYDYDYERDKDRSRDKDRDRKRRRDREAEEDDRDYDDDKHRSSRRGRKDRDRERDRGRDNDYEYEKEPTSATSARSARSARAVSPPLNAPTGPSADNFSIRGVSKVQKASAAMLPPQPPTGPRAFQPPKGPSADRVSEIARREHKRKGSLSTSQPSTPTTPTVPDHYAAERERNARERDRLDRNPHVRTTPSRHSLSSKRSRDDFEQPALSPRESEPMEIKPPTGPSAHRDKRRKSGASGADDGEGGGKDLATRLTQGLRKKAGAPRRGGVKNEGDVERELERVERERDGRRW